METRVCLTCHEEQLITFFPRRIRNRSGLNLHCKKCVAAYARAWRKRKADQDPMRAIKQAEREERRLGRKESSRRYQQEYYQARREKVLARQRNYYQIKKVEILVRNARYDKDHRPQRNARRRVVYQRNPTKHRARARIYSKTHPQQIRTKAQRWYAENRDRIRRQKRSWHERNKDRANAKHREWRRVNPEKVSAQKATRLARIRNAPIIESVSLDVIYKRDKAICQICLKPCRRTEASRDHVIPVSQGGEHSYRNIVLAHRLCNGRKSNGHDIPQQQRLF